MQCAPEKKQSWLHDGCDIADKCYHKAVEFGGVKLPQRQRKCGPGKNDSCSSLLQLCISTEITLMMLHDEIKVKIRILSPSLSNKQDNATRVAP